MKIGPPNSGENRELAGKPFAAGIGEEENEQRPEFQRHFQQRADFGGHFGAFFLIALDVHASNSRNSLGEIACLEAQIVNPLADADEIDRQFVLGGDGDEDAAASRAIQFCHNQAVDARHVTEDLVACSSWRSGRSSHRASGERCAASGSGRRARARFFQFRHQFRLVLQT